MTTFDVPLYELVGGEMGLRALVDKFYDIMDSAPEAKIIRALHPDSLDSSRDKLFMFLSGWSGGPALYVQTYGNPRLRQRHMPFPIGRAEREQWLWCMDQALNQTQSDPELIEHLKKKFGEIANSMQNRVDLDL